MATTTLTPRRVSARHTTVALKIVMALSGILLVLFLLGHMYGNLKAFAGADTFNMYAHHLRTIGEPILPFTGFLWLFRVVMLTAILAHIFSAVTLWRRNAAARENRYQVNKRNRRPYAETIMRFGGLTIAAFIIFHLLQFTTNTIRLSGNHEDPFHRMVAGFSVWWCVVFYIIAVALVCYHVAHGVWSALQTLGYAGSRHEKLVTGIGHAIAALLFLGFASVPIAVLTGFIHA